MHKSTSIISSLVHQLTVIYILPSLTIVNQPLKLIPSIYPLERRIAANTLSTV